MSSSLNGTHFTPTQVRILDTLKDGLPHHRLEMKACLNDDLNSLGILSCHIVLLRKKLRQLGQDIVCELKGKSICYRHVILLVPENIPVSGNSLKPPA